MLAYILSSFLLLACGTLGWKPGVRIQGLASINYTTVTGFFLQDDASTSPSTFDYASNHFGLINRTYPTDTRGGCRARTQWQRFFRYIDHLNQASDDKTAYKVLVLGRHGEGWHNAAESFYGTPAWNCYWSELDGNGTAVWADPALTPNGINQAVKANRFWAAEMAEQGMPAPESFYSSPLQRCLLTANLTFGNLSLPRTRPFRPVIKEFLREGISTHTCDRRSNKSWIEALFPSWPFEAGFSERDLLWNGTFGESAGAQSVRSKRLLDDVFTKDGKTLISMTSHSGEIASILGVLGHRSFSLSTGQIIPVLVKAEWTSQSLPISTAEPWASQATCTTPPVTSRADTGCVCSAAPTPTSNPSSTLG